MAERHCGVAVLFSVRCRPGAFHALVFAAFARPLKAADTLGDVEFVTNPIMPWPEPRLIGQANLNLLRPVLHR